MKNLDNLISVYEYAKIKGYSRQAVYKAISEGRLKLGTDYKIIAGRKFMVKK